MLKISVSSFISLSCSLPRLEKCSSGAGFWRSSMRTLAALMEDLPEGVYRNFVCLG